MYRSNNAQSEFFFLRLDIVHYLALFCLLCEFNTLESYKVFNYSEGAHFIDVV